MYNVHMYKLYLSTYMSSVYCYERMYIHITCKVLAHVVHSNTTLNFPTFGGLQVNVLAEDNDYMTTSVCIMHVDMCRCM